MNIDDNKYNLIFDNEISFDLLDVKEITKKLIRDKLIILMNVFVPIEM